MADEEAVTEETEEVIEDSTINVFDETTDEADADEVKGEEQTEETAESTDESEESESEPPSQNHVPIAALTAERRKRQEAAAKLEHYEEIPDPVENPREYAEFVKAQAEGNSLQDRINLSRSIMVDMDPEYTRYEAEFMAAVSKQGEDGNIEIINQDLFNQFRESPNPAVFARDLGKDILLYKQRSDPDYEQKLRQQWEAEKAVMPDLTTATASGANSEPVDKPTDLNSVFDGSPL